jgi:trans-2,3-dihydro-3-hydroxyanthranilate isomerase
MPREFETCDVFTDTRFGGNPLAVVYDPMGLDTAAMQAIAREFNLSETVFVLASDAATATASIRIFTPAIEMPFAGHPNVGTAVLLARRLGLAGDKLALDQPAGRVEARLLRDAAGQVTGAEITAPRPFLRGESLDPAAVAACAGLPAEAVRRTTHAPCLGGCGATFAIAELVDAEALAAAAPDLAAFRTALPVERAVGLHLHVALAPGRRRARMFAPLGGVAEDPATGSANVALGGLLLDVDGASALALEVEQGIEMGRPSLLRLAAARDSAGAIRVRVGGGVVPVSRGALVE